ncbi:CocE/NonD family hydrolase [Tateyamaria sp. SN3-11]|uniref:CocE/NonD family hydrolase n=1 Tax=Tateyamaria sp. SN3-11 TaxID=3092147 RepID=UPI0039E85EA1
MKRAIIGTAIGLSSAIAVAVIGGFAYLPAAFEAKYDGPTLATSDGTKLVTFVRLPQGDGPFPTLIVRSPYELPHTPLSGLHGMDLTSIPDEDLGEHGWPEITEAGYALVIQHTRGRIGSEGLALGQYDRSDAIELAQWVRQQPWSNGKIGTTGDSIEAINAMLTNAEADAGIDASFVQIGTPDLINGALKGPGGALKLETFLPWSAEQILTADAHHYDQLGYGPITRRTSIVGMGVQVGKLLSNLEDAHTVEAWWKLPLAEYPHFSKAASGWKNILESRPDSPVSTYYDAQVTNVPTFYVAAWFDVFAPSQLTAFELGEQAGADQRLLVLNGTHFTPEEPGVWPIQPILPWFDYHLKGERNALVDLPRVIFPIANAKDEWYGSDTWPPIQTSADTWHLTKTGRVSRTMPSREQSGTRVYTYDPENPVPTVGGRNLMISHGPLNQSSVREGQRSDVLSYDSDTLDAELVVAGHVYGTLTVSSDAPDTDFTIKVMDVAPDGSATLVTEGIQRARFRNGLGSETFMEPGQSYQLRIDLGHIAWRFAQGHRVAVDISSSNFPQWDRNLNTNDPLYSSTRIQVARNFVHHESQEGSYIQLPVLSDMSELQRLDDFQTSTQR